MRPFCLSTSAARIACQREVLPPNGSHMLPEPSTTKTTVGDLQWAMVDGSTITLGPPFELPKPLPEDAACPPTPSTDDPCPPAPVPTMPTPAVPFTPSGLFRSEPVSDEPHPAAATSSTA